MVGSSEINPPPPSPTKQKITINHEDNPHWLSTEECLARGIAQEDVSSFQ